MVIMPLMPYGSEQKKLFIGEGRGKLVGFREELEELRLAELARKNARFEERQHAIASTAGKQTTAAGLAQLQRAEGFTE